MNNEHLSEEAKKLMALAGIQEDDKKFLKNESFSEASKEAEVEKNSTPTSDSDTNFIIMEFDQEEVEPGSDDDKLYKIG